MAIRTEIVVNLDGTESVTQTQVPDTPDRGAIHGNDGLESAAARYRRRFAALHTEGAFVRILIPNEETGKNEEWLIKMLSASEIKQCGLSLSRAGVALTDVDDAAYYDTLYAALLFHGVWDATTGAHFFVDEQEAREFWNTPGQVASTALYLVESIVDINPFPDSVGEAVGRPDHARYQLLWRLQRLIQMRGKLWILHVTMGWKPVRSWGFWGLSSRVNAMPLSKLPSISTPWRA